MNSRWRLWCASLLVLTLAFSLARDWGLVRLAPPQPAVSSYRTPRAPEHRCAECHSDVVEAFKGAPHSQTLARGTDAQVLAQFQSRTFHRDDTGADYRYELRDGRLLVESSAYARPLPIDWVFGSGTHARTPLLLLDDPTGRQSSIEHSVSWYPPGDLGVTLGMEVMHETDGVRALGVYRHAAETVNCFGCHATFVPLEDGRIDFDHMIAGVGCARCHWDTQRHVAEMDHGEAVTIERFSQLTPIDSVNRCGECHRRTEELGGPIDPADASIVRFASVGLVQSPCFQRQQEVQLASDEDDNGRPARLDCVSCHDPHRPTNSDWRHHTAVCLKCHDAAHERASDCPVASRDSNCLDCHMPKVPANAFLHFTDHWIRKRSP